LIFSFNFFERKLAQVYQIFCSLYSSRLELMTCLSSRLGCRADFFLSQAIGLFPFNSFFDSSVLHSESLFSKKKSYTSKSLGTMHFVGMTPWKVVGKRPHQDVEQAPQEGHSKFGMKWWGTNLMKLVCGDVIYLPSNKISASELQIWLNSWVEEMKNFELETRWAENLIHLCKLPFKKIKREDQRAWKLSN